MDRKDTVLIVCAVPETRKQLRFVLSEGFHLLEASGAPQMTALLQQNTQSIAAVVLGTSAMENGGSELLQKTYPQGLPGGIPAVIIQEEDADDCAGVMLQSGAADVIGLHTDAHVMLHRVNTAAQLYMYRAHMEKLLQERADILRQSNDTMVDALSSIIEYRSAESGNHVLRVRNFVRTLLEEVMHRCPEYQLTQRMVDIISSASAMHDVGKITIPDAILNKAGPLTPEEWAVMKTHSVTGCRILETFGSMVDREYLSYAKNICRYHHERWDGGGYPEGLAGDQIPICAQVVGLADAYEALTSRRVYKEAYAFDQAINMILKGECGAFSPKLLACLKNVTEKYEQLTKAYADGKPIEEGNITIAQPSPESGVGSLERTQAMYYALVHYINGFLLEVNLEQGLFHVVYNPYPELARLEGITTLSQLTALMLDEIVVPQERQRMQALIFEDLPRFIEENLRRATYRFHYRELEKGQGGQFEMTLLRNAVPGSKRKSLAILLRKVSEAKGAYTSAWYSLAESTYVCRNDRNFTLVSLDRESTGLGGYSPEELYDKFGGRLIQLIHPDDRVQVRQEVTRQLRIGTEVRIEHRVMLKSGNVMWVTNKSRLAVGPDGQELLHCFLTDITETRLAVEELRRQNDRYISTLGKTNTVLFDWDMATDLVEFSDTWDTLFHYQPPEGKVRSWLTRETRVHPDDVSLLLDRIVNLENGSDAETQEVRIATDRGRYVWYRVQAHGERDQKGDLIRVMGVITSVDAEKQKEQALQDRAERDALTRLLNKEAGRRRISAYMAQYPQGASCAMLIIDLDDFKQVNDTFGHLFGDSVLSKVAQDIKGQFKDQDIVCRIGGDEFMVLVRGLTDRRVLEDRCRRLIATFCSSLKARHPALTISCSIGIALAPEHGKSYHELFSYADQALYRAKAQGKNTYQFYDPDQSGVPGLYQAAAAVRSRIDSDEEPGLAEDTIVRHAFQLLYSAQDTVAAVNEVIGFLGRKLNASRVYIFENSPDNRYCSNTFEWCNEGVEPQIQFLQDISYADDIPGYAECLTEQDILYCSDIRELPEPIFRILEPQGIRSMLHCAVRTDGVLRGYIGFDDCVNHRMWTKEEIQVLTFLTEVLSLFLPKARQQEETASKAQDVFSMLDSQDTWIYIIDPDTWQIRYLNRKAKEYTPNAQVGCPCYETIYGRSSPCPGCASVDIREKKASRTLQRDGEDVKLFESTLIGWEGKDCCMMTVRILPKLE